MKAPVFKKPRHYRDGFGFFIIQTPASVKVVAADDLTTVRRFPTVLLAATWIGLHLCYSIEEIKRMVYKTDFVF